MSKHCTFKHPDGTSCRGYRITDSLFCYWHCPGKAQERQLARERGGRSTAKMAMTKALVGEIVGDAEDLDSGSNGEPKQTTLDHCQIINENLSQEVKDGKKYGKLSLAAIAELRRLNDQLLKIQVVRGLGAEARLTELEQEQRDFFKQKKLN